MTTVESDVSTEKPITELRSIKRQAKFTNVMASIGVGLLAASVSKELIGPAVYFVMIAVCVCLAMR